MLLLGDQLMRDAGIAVFELVKNAYDADAETVSVTLKDIHDDVNTASIVVEDNGDGMTRSTVTKIWLSPGTAHRLTQRLRRDPKRRRTPRHKRLPLGEKGVGRFAAHKLGNRVELVTRARRNREVVVSIDWRLFDSDRPLSEIPVMVRTRKPSVFLGAKHGTRITITDLRERPWDRRRVQALYRAIVSICSPTQGPESFQASVSLSPDPHKWIADTPSATDVMNAALFRIRGHIESDAIVYDYEFKPPATMDRVTAREEKSKRTAFPRRSRTRVGIEDAREHTVDLTSHRIGRVEFDFAVFDRERRTLSFMPIDSKLLRGFLDHNGGVRVYRDGVRVYNFGEPGNDWLGLGSARVNVPSRRIGNNQVVGVVRLALADSQDLIEKTNREGFVENEAYRQFERAVDFAVRQAEFERNIDKQRIREAYSTPTQKEPVLADLGLLRDELEALDLPSPEKTRLKNYVDRIDVQYREVLDRLLTAAGAGLNLALVLHEIEKRIHTLATAVNSNEDRSLLLKRAKDLVEMVDSVTWLTRQSGITNVPAAELIEQCVFAWKFRFERHSVSVVNGFVSNGVDFMVRGNRRLLLTALMNLVDNAIYWLSTKPADRRMYIGPGKTDRNRSAIVVADNGPGFSEPPDYLVMPFFTKRADGMGLGLHLADEIMKAQGGKLLFPEKGQYPVPHEFTGAVVALELGE